MQFIANGKESKMSVTELHKVETQVSWQQTEEY